MYPSLLNFFPTIYPNRCKKSISLFNFLKKIEKHMSCSFDKFSTLFHSPGFQPFLTLLFVIQMTLDEVITITAPKLLFKSMPKLITRLIGLFSRMKIFGVISSELHSDDHHRTCEVSTQGTFPCNSCAQSSSQLRNEWILITQILLETQGD